MSTIARRFHLAGKVQGVFFRASTRDVAQSLGLRGHAINLRDGRVEVLAVGEPEKITELESWLWQGSPLSWVEAITAEEVTLPELPAGFTTGNR
ncbi:MAG: acylphosphatase [Pseudomonadota bacterium]